MYSCEILILPHDGTTDDTLCLAQRRSAVIFHDRASLCGSFQGGMSVVSVSCWFMLQRNTPPLSFLPCSYLWTPEEMEPLTLSVGCLSSCNFPCTRWRCMLLLRFDCRTGVTLRRHKVGIYNRGRVTFCPFRRPLVFKKLQASGSGKH